MIWSYSSGLSLADRGLQYGDGLFETLLVVNPATATPSFVWLLAEHLHRLQQGCARLGIEYPHATLPKLVDTAVSRAVDRLTVLKIVISANVAGRGYGRPSLVPANLHLSLHPVGEHLQAGPALAQPGVRLRVAQLHLASQPLLAGLKHLNRLEQVLARRELQPGDFEMLLQNPEQGVVETTASNVFAVLDGQLCTPPINLCGVDGVLRQWLLVQLKSELQVCTMSLAQLRRAEEVLIGNSVMGLRRVSELVASGGEHDNQASSQQPWQQQYSQGPWYDRLLKLIQRQLPVMQAN